MMQDLCQELAVTSRRANLILDVNKRDRERTFFPSIGLLVLPDTVTHKFNMDIISLIAL